MIELPVRTPRAALTDVQTQLLDIRGRRPSETDLALSIRMQDTELGVRDLGTFLQFIDSIYGQLNDRGLRAYSQRVSSHLRIKEVQAGSWEIVLIEAQTRRESVALLVVFQALKYLPPGLASIATSYNHIEQARLARQSRKLIRHQIEAEEKLRGLSKRRREQFAALVVEMIRLEGVNLPGTIRFTHENLEDLELYFREPISNKDK